MSSSGFDYQDLLQLVELIKSTSQFSEFRLRANGIELELRRGPAGPAPAAIAAPSPNAAAAPPPAAPAGSVEPPSRPAPPAPREAAADDPDPDAVRAPMVGTVYLAPEPGAQPFVRLGQRVEVDTQLCIVEVMKLMNAIPAGRAGVVSRILVGDADAVEYGQPLFVISPN